MDLLISNAVLPGRSGRWAIAIHHGRIQHIEPELSIPAQTVIDADGQLVIPGLVDGHFHLDKVRILTRCQAVTGNFQEALEQTLKAKQAFTFEDIQARASQHIEQVMTMGTTTMRSHVEVDPTIGLTGLKALLPVRDRYRDRFTLQVAVFAQEGITQTPGTADLLREAMRMGGDVIGSAPYVDPDPEQNICTVFDIAEEFDCDVDFHLDFLDDDEPLSVSTVIEETLKRGWQGRVCLGHMTKLAALEPEALGAIAHQLADAEISVLALPASDLYMMGRRDLYNQRRGVAPIHQLAEAGVTVGVASNNVQNLFTPFGDGDMLKITTLIAQVLHLGTPKHHEFCLGMTTTEAAKAIGMADYGLMPGCQADLVILDAASVSEAVGAAPLERTVIKSGVVVAQRRVSQYIKPD
ncbi:MAG: amidohydrolase family protein [Leptolyngbyaceae bacterium]|nr:amidohydrolase family protein [Leptolyngbyaceae bacterium]